MIDLAHTDATFTREEVFALIEAAMKGRMLASIADQQTSDWHDKRGELQRAADYECSATTHYDEADGVRYTLMEFGMDFDRALALRDKMWVDLNKQYNEKG